MKLTKKLSTSVALVVLLFSLAGCRELNDNTISDKESKVTTANTSSTTQDEKVYTPNTHQTVDETTTFVEATTGEEENHVVADDNKVTDTTDISVSSVTEPSENLTNQITDEPETNNLWALIMDCNSDVTSFKAVTIAEVAFGENVKEEDMETITKIEYEYDSSSDIMYSKTNMLGFTIYQYAHRKGEIVESYTSMDGLSWVYEDAATYNEQEAQKSITEVLKSCEFEPQGMEKIDGTQYKVTGQMYGIEVDDNGKDSLDKDTVIHVELFVDAAANRIVKVVQTTADSIQTSRATTTYDRFNEVSVEIPEDVLNGLVPEINSIDFSGTIQ